MKVRQQLVTNLAKTNGRGMTPTSLTIHQTDNFREGANSAAHANLQSRLGAKQASWHWQVDDVEAVQSFLEDVRCWHAGTAPGNNTSIAIEMCVNPDSDYEKTFDNGARLAAQILKRHRLPLAVMVQHNYWTGKNCPSQIRHDGDWPRFQALVTHYLNNNNPTEKEGFLMALTDSQQKLLFGRIQNIQDILTGYEGNSYVKRGMNFPLAAARVRQLKDYATQGGPDGNAVTVYTKILDTLEGIEERLARLENKGA